MNKRLLNITKDLLERVLGKGSWDALEKHWNGDLLESKETERAYKVYTRLMGGLTDVQLNYANFNHVELKSVSDNKIIKENDL